ncbi:hypothetical protein ACGFYE_04765 [Streptomyces zaomyceticus]|uniref:hypothetical protein n=1 Tax=Streptomyces zaomyceticus TaxID=68286 RepID=UPI0037240B69
MRAAHPTRHLVPLLENATRDCGIPEERLKELGRHHFPFDGVSRSTITTAP